MTWLNYHHLFYFKTIAETGSVSVAAKKLRLGQPTLSAQLRVFEDQIGIALFERKHKKLILTEQGKVALEYARNIFSLGTEMIEVLKDRIDTPKPILHIGALDSIPKQIVASLVQKALKSSQCKVVVVEGKQDELLRELFTHRIDLLVTNYLPVGREVAGISHRMITRKPAAIFAAPKYKVLRKGFPGSISGVPIILPTFDSKLRQDLDHWARLNELTLNIVAESQDIAIKKQLAIMEVGIIPTATHTVVAQVLAGELIEIGILKGVYEELYLVSAERKIANPIAAMLLKSFAV